MTAMDAAAAGAVWTPRPLNDLKISSIYNRSATEAPAEVSLNLIYIPHTYCSTVKFYGLWVECEKCCFSVICNFAIIYVDRPAIGLFRMYVFVNIARPDLYEMYARHYQGRIEMCKVIVTREILQSEFQGRRENEN